MCNAELAAHAQATADIAVVEGGAERGLVSVFPSLPRRGGCGINKKSRSHRRAADGVVNHTTRLRTHCETELVIDHPVRAFSEGDHFFDGAATPPWQGGENAQPETPAASRPFPYSGR